MEKILSIPVKLNFTLNTLGCLVFRLRMRNTRAGTQGSISEIAKSRSGPELFEGPHDSANTKDLTAFKLSSLLMASP